MHLTPKFHPDESNQLTKLHWAAPFLEAYNLNVVPMHQSKTKASWHGSKMVRVLQWGAAIPCPNPTLENHPFLVVCECLFDILATTRPIGVRSSIRNGRKQQALNITTVKYIYALFTLHATRMFFAPKYVRQPEANLDLLHFLKYPVNSMTFWAKHYCIQNFCFAFLYNFSLNVASTQEYLRRHNLTWDSM